MNTQTKTYMKQVKTPSKQHGVVVMPVAFLAVALGLVGVGIDNNIHKERTNYSAEAPEKTQQQEAANKDMEDFFASME